MTRWTILLLLLAVVACGEGPAAAQDVPDGTTTDVDPPAPVTVGPQVKLPVPEEIVLGNGVHVWLLPDAEVPLVNLEARVFTGLAGDVPSAAGRTALLAEMLRRGAGTRDAHAFESAIDRVGGQFSIDARPREVQISCEFLAEDAELAVALVGDVLTAPRFDPEEFEKARQQMVDRLAAARDAPNAVIDTYWRAWLHQDHWMGVPAGGTESTLAALTLDAVKGAFRRVNGSVTIVAIAGAFDLEKTRAQARAAFGKIPPQQFGGQQIQPAGPLRSGVLLVDKPDSLQTYIRFGGAGIDWTHPSYPARLLANTVLGARFTSRLNTALRIESGLTYGAGSRFDDRRGGAFAVRTFTETSRSKETLDLAAATVAKFVADGMTEAELASAKAYVMGQYAPDNLETVDQRVSTLLDLYSFGLPRAHVEGLFARLGELKLDDVNAVIRAHFPAAPWTWVLIGQAETLRPLAKELGDVTEVKLADPGFGPR